MPYKEFFLKNALKDNIYTYNKYFKPIKSIKKIKNIKTFEDDIIEDIKDKGSKNKDIKNKDIKNIQDLTNIFFYNPSSLYDCNKNGQLINIPNLNDRNFFLFYFFQQCPSPDDERYKFIKKVSSKEYKHGLERSRCFEFEILARDPKNVYAIEDTIEYYYKNQKIIEKYFHTPKKVELLDTPEHSENTEISDLHKYKDEDNSICNAFRRKLQNLRLVEYKYFEEHEKFQHWAINPFIYEIMNWALYKENERYKYEIIDFPSGLQQINQYKNIGLKSFESYTKEQNQEKINSWSRNIKTLNDYTHLSTIVDLTEQSKHKFPIVGNYPAKFSNDSQKNEVVYSYHYPRCREYPKLTINIDLNRDKQQVENLIKETIKLIFEKYASEKVIEKNRSIDTDSMPYSLFNFETTIKGSVSLEEKFFAYDYITYRKEQKNKYNQLKIKHLYEYSTYDIEKLEIFKQFSEDIKENYKTIQDSDDNEAKKYIINQIKEKLKIILNELNIDNLDNLSLTEIEELNLLDILSYKKQKKCNNIKLKKDTEIKKYVIEEIKKAIEKQKINLDRLDTKNLDDLTLDEIKELNLLDLLTKDEKDYINNDLDFEKDTEIKKYVIDEIEKALQKQKNDLDISNIKDLNELTLNEIKESNLFKQLTKDEKDFINNTLESGKNTEIREYVIEEIKKAQKKLKAIIKELYTKKLDNLKLNEIEELKDFDKSNNSDKFDKYKLLDILDKEEKDHYFDMKSNRDNEIKKYIIEEIKEIEKGQIINIDDELFGFKLSIGKINKNNELKNSRSIKNYYNEIKKLIEYSKSHNDFL